MLNTTYNTDFKIIFQKKILTLVEDVWKNMSDPTSKANLRTQVVGTGEIPR
jgi:hypothetical protein